MMTDLLPEYEDCTTDGCLLEGEYDDFFDTVLCTVHAEIAYEEERAELAIERYLEARAYDEGYDGRGYYHA